MDFDHIMKVIDETNMDYLDSDIPLAIFMINILSVKLNVNNIIGSTEEGFNRYMKSDKPIKFRYYLQVTMKDEINNACDEKVEAMNEGIKKVGEIIIKQNRHIYVVPSYEDRMYIYDNYLKDIDEGRIKSYETTCQGMGLGRTSLKEVIDKWKYDYENSDVPGSISVNTLQNDIKFVEHIVNNVIIKKYNFYNTSRVQRCPYVVSVIWLYSNL